jgi:hypothetical protein
MQLFPLYVSESVKFILKWLQLTATNKEHKRLHIVLRNNFRSQTSAINLTTTNVTARYGTRIFGIGYVGNVQV